jgi:RNA 2',3'-cyclic 3'-phosphodiesterase
MRLFLAINLPPKIKKQISNQIARMKIEYPDFNWVGENNFHITLFFLGEIMGPEKVIRKIKDALYDQEMFYFYSTEAGLFMNGKIVIYLGFRREKKTEELVEKVKQAFQIKDTKRFVPHLTLARYRIPSKQQYFVLKKRLRSLKIDVEFPVRKLILFQSVLGAGHPLYKKIKSFELLPIK